MAGRSAGSTPGDKGEGRALVQTLGGGGGGGGVDGLHHLDITYKNEIVEVKVTS